MNRKGLYNCFNEIDDDILERSENAAQIKKKPPYHRWAALAACFCLLAVAVTVVPRLLPENTLTPPDISELPVQSNPNPPEGSKDSEGCNPWQVNFNSVTMIMDAARVYIPGYFTEKLNEEEIAALEPGMRIEFMQYSGHAGFDGEGKLADVSLVVTTSIPDNNVSISISQGGIVRDYVLDDKPVVSVCNKVQYKVYQWESATNRVTLMADAIINDCTYAFTLETSQHNLEQAKEDFTRILECFAYYADGKPDLSVIVADEIPEWFDYPLSYEESLDDPSFDFLLFISCGLPGGKENPPASCQRV